MRKRGLGKHVRRLGPRSHLLKEGTPTMGGVVILFVWGSCLALLSWSGSLSPAAATVYVAAVLFGIIGLLDDLLSQRRRRNDSGLRPWQKIALGTAAWAFLIGLFPELRQTAYSVPFSSAAVRIPSWLAFPVTWFVFTGATNSMNLTDGLDGLAAGVAAVSMLGLAVALPESVSTSAVIPLIGILVGFLWINSYPSKLFMGDVGSFALGGAVASLTVTHGLVLYLPFFAAVPLLEALSVIAQVGLYRVTGRRLFRMSPLHHHFEEISVPERPFLLPAATWVEPSITLRFWMIHALCVALGVLAVR